MFWVFGSLHQKPRVGGTLGCVLRDGSDGWRSLVPRGDNTGANHPVSVPPTGNFLKGFYCCGTSVRSTRGVVTSFLTRCRGSRLPRPRRCGDFGLVSRHKPAEHRFLMFPLFPTLRRRASHADERLRHQRLSHAGVRLRNQRLSDHQSSPACHGQTAGITFQLSP